MKSEQKPKTMRVKGYAGGGCVMKSKKYADGGKIKMGLKPEKEERSYRGYGAARKGK